MTNKTYTVVVEHIESGDMYRVDGPASPSGGAMRLKYEAISKLRVDHPEGDWEILVDPFKGSWITNVSNCVESGNGRGSCGGDR